MMTRNIKRFSTIAFALLSGLLFAPVAGAIEFQDVKNFDEVFVISGQAPARDRVEVRWDIEENYYLYNNRFLKFEAVTEGVILGEPQLPQGKVSFDELLGEEVEKFHKQMVVTLPLVSVPPGVQLVDLDIRSQGCLESELCYPPTKQALTVELPAGALGDGSSILSGLAAAPFEGLAQADPLTAGRDPALPPEEAFVYESIGFDAGSALVRFTAQPGYYLYRNKFEFRLTSTGPDTQGFSIASVELPAGVIKDDPEFGEVPVYYGEVEIPVRFSRPAGEAVQISMEADFQGCRDGDICYPPMKRLVSFQMPAAPETIAASRAAEQSAQARLGSSDTFAASPVSEQDKLARLLIDNPSKAIVAFFIAGLLLAFTPCVFPMVPILSGIIVGQGDRLTTARAFWLSLVYVLAMAVTYTVAGVLAGLFGQNLQAVFQNPWILSAFVLVFILLALSMFGFYELQLPSRLQTRLTEVSNQQKSGQWGGVAVMGFLSALIVGPCVAPPLMAALIVIGSSGSATLGGAALFALAMGMGAPLILFGVSAGKLVPRAGAWMDAVKAVFGVGLLALAIWMLERIVPGGIIMLLWGALAIACGVYLGALDRLPDGVSGWRKLWKSLGVLLLTLGILELVGAAAGGDYWLKPLEPFQGGSGAAVEQDHVEFKPIKSNEDLDQAVALAAASGKGAMLDFYADWCVECKRMERLTFPDPAVASRLERLQPLQADVTANDDVDQALMRRFNIIGPPAILFFDRTGEEIPGLRLVGFFDAEEFAAHLDRFLQAN